MKGFSPNMMTVGIGVQDRLLAKDIAADLMGYANPLEGDQKRITEDTSATYLRTFEPAPSRRKCVQTTWIDLVVLYKSRESADTIADWLYKALGQHRGEIRMKVDTCEVQPTAESLRKAIREGIQNRHTLRQRLCK